MGSCFSYLFFAVFSMLGMHYLCNLKWLFFFIKKSSKSSIQGKSHENGERNIGRISGVPGIENLW
jgi:hypothetical protein